jgi:hypothetical protein
VQGVREAPRRIVESRREDDDRALAAFLQTAAPMQTANAAPSGPLRIAARAVFDGRHVDAGALMSIAAAARTASELAGGRGRPLVATLERTAPLVRESSWARRQFFHAARAFLAILESEGEVAVQNDA